MNAATRWIPPAIPHRRYPSLSDDFQPSSSRGANTPWTAQTTSEVAANPSFESNHPRIPYVRVFALLAIAALIALLVVGA